MSEQPVTALYPVANSRLGHNCLEIVELLPVGVVSERFGVREILTILPYAAPGKVERHRAIAAGGHRVRCVRV